MRRWAASRPVAIGIAVVLLVVAIASGSVLQGPRDDLRERVGVGVDILARQHDLVTLLSSVVFTNDIVELLLVLLVLLTVFGWAEQLLGWWRTILAYIVTAVLGILAGVGLQAAGLLARGLWTTPPATVIVVDPFTPVIGTLLTASAFAGPLWRRRVRVLGLSGLVVLLLYSGQPSDLYRLTAGIVGLVLGILLARRRPRIHWPRSSHHETRSLLASITAVSAIGPFVAVVAPHGYGLLRPLGVLFRNSLPNIANLREACRAAEPAIDCAREVALERLNGPGAVILTPLPLLVLLVAAFGMWRGRRVSAVAAIVVSLLLAVLAGIYYGFLPALLDPDELQLPNSEGGPTLQTALAVAVPAATAVLTFLRLRDFDVLPERRAVRVFGAVTAGVLVAVSGIYLGAGWALRDQFLPHVGLLDLLSDLPERFVPVGFLRLRRLDFLPVTVTSRILYDWIGPVFWGTVLVGLAICSIGVRDAPTAAANARIRRLLKVASHGPIAYMATWPGNHYWFSEDGSHAVAFREASGVALTLGEPIGPDDGALAAARAFALSCDDRGLTPAFYSVRPEFAAGLGGAGTPWQSVLIAEDTVLTPKTFAMSGKKWQDVRSSFNRAERQGVRAVWTEWDQCSLSVRTQIESIAEAWVADRGMPELGFTIGGVAQLRDPEVRLMLAIGHGERVEAVTSWLPTWRNGEVIGLTLDFMRRRFESMNGVVEFLIASVALAAKQRDLEFVSLSAAPLVTTGADDDANRVERVLGTLSNVLEPVYGFRSLAAFKEKFRPRLEPLVLAYPDALALPPIGVALSRAYLPSMSLPQVVRIVGALRQD